MSRRLSVLMLSVLALVTLQGCFKMDFSGLESGLESSGFGGGGGWGVTCDGPVHAITYITLTSSSFEYYTQLGDSVTISASLMDGACTPVVMDLTSNWSTSAPEVVSITPQRPAGERAIATPRALGAAEIKVTINSVVGTTWVHVVPRIAAMEMVPASATVRMGDSVFVSATLTDPAGKVVNDVPVNFYADYSDVIEVRVGPNGMWVHGRTVGIASVQARVFERFSTSKITVVAR